MRRKFVVLFVCVAAALSATVSRATAQEQPPEPSNTLKLRGYFIVKRPAQPITMDMVRSAAGTATLPVWTFDLVSSRDGNEYQGAMVGRNPFNNPGSVSVPTDVIPLVIKTNTIAASIDTTTGLITTIPGITSFNPGVADTACLKAPNNIPTGLFAQSPIFRPARFELGGISLGTTQYADAFQRGNFWNVLGRKINSYHVLLGPVKVLPPILVNVPSNYGTSIPAELSLGCGPLGIVDIDWFDNLLISSIIPGLAAKGVHPTSFPIFFMHNVVDASPVTDFDTCCILGYHSATGPQMPTQTYSVVDFDSTKFFINASGDSGPFSDVAIGSHEVAEWMDDPFGTNEAPPWGNVGQVAGCDNSLEVGDPLTGTEYPPVQSRGFTYHLQELAFFSWFFGAPSFAIDSSFSDNGSFLTDAGPPCH